MIPVIGDNSRRTSLGADTAATSVTQITAAGAANTKGAYAQIVANLPFDVDGLYISGGPPEQFTGCNALVDLALGAAASEVVKVPNIHVPNGFGLGLNLPVSMKAGQRLSARMQADVAGATLKLGVIAKARGVWSTPGMPRVDTVADLTTSKGVALTDPGSANVKGTWTQLWASLPFAVKRIIMIGLPETISMNANTQSLIDLGVGGAGSEVVIMPNLWAFGRSFSATTRCGWLDFSCDLSAGTRLSARFQSANGNATDRGTRIQVLIFG